MQISSEISIWGVTIYTQGLFLVTAFLFSLYALWTESRKDGFDEEKIFDRYVLSTLVAILVSRAFYAQGARYLPFPLLNHVIQVWKPGFSFQGFLLGFIAASIGITYLAKWSVFRILDIFSLALSFGAPMAIFGYVALQKDFRYLIPAGVLWIFYGIFSTFRLKRFISGVTFVVFLVLVIIARALLGFNEAPDLLFDAILFTIGTTVLILRIIKTMPKNRDKNLPQSLIDSVKSALTKKQKGLEKQEKLLEEEDPYMQEGRAVGNSENVDEAYLEDTFKNIIDAQRNVLKSVKGNVKKALSKLSKGEYGKCEKCGVDIDPARLKAYPEATYCSECARKKEATQAE